MWLTKRKEVVFLEIFTFDCKGCGKCIRKCKEDVLEMIHNGYCQYTIVKNSPNCNGCGKCVNVCNSKAIQLVVID